MTKRVVDELVEHLNNADDKMDWNDKEQKALYMRMYRKRQKKQVLVSGVWSVELGEETDRIPDKGEVQVLKATLCFKGKPLKDVTMMCAYEKETREAAGVVGEHGEEIERHIARCLAEANKRRRAAAERALVRGFGEALNDLSDLHFHTVPEPE